MADLASRISRPTATGDAPAGGNGSSDAAAPVEDVAKTDEEAVTQPGGGINESTYEVEVKLSDLTEGQPDNPLRAINRFEELNLKAPILEGIYAQGFKKPSKIQERSLPLMMSDPPRNMIAQSQSGTGKTAAFVLTMLHRVNFDDPRPQALCLAPSRELARQIQSVVEGLGRFCTGVKVQAAVPGSISREHGVQGNIVCGTPGTVMDSIRRRQFDPSNLKILVIDEADNMLDQQGMGDQSVRVRNLIPKTVQVLLFSATFPDQVMKYAEKYAPNANALRLRQQDLTVKGISQMYMDCPSDSSKYDILCKLYELMTVGSSVIFVKTRDSADEIQRRMEADGHRVASLHGAFEGAQRDALLQEFRSGKSKVLITTNVMARGIDVSTVSMVINYDIPMKGVREHEPDPETYLHRIGRTGRFGRVGVSISFVSDKKSFMAVNQIADTFGIDLVQLSPDDWDDTEAKIKQVIRSARANPDYKGDV